MAQQFAQFDLDHPVELHNEYVVDADTQAAKTKLSKLFAFLVHNFVDDSLQIRPKPGWARLSQGCLHFTQYGG